MKLTGKAQEDFDLWFFERNTPIEEYKNYPNLSETCKNALIVEWFDSVGIIIEINLDQTTYPKYHYEIFKYEHFGNYNALYNDGLYANRQQVTTEAIEKANEIYNNDK